MIKFDVLNRYSGEVQFTAEIECSVDEKKSWKLRLAVLWAIENSADLRRADLRRADLRRADLSSADLRFANLRSADLSSADLRSADLSSANLRSADLHSADLYSADLHSADLRRADLSSADLSFSDLSSADLRSADLHSADLRSADLYSADLYSADLRHAKLCFAMGNGRELKSIIATKYIITWSETHMAIGCEQHTIKQWLSFNEKQISEMNEGALEWCKVWKPIIKSIIDAG